MCNAKIAILFYISVLVIWQPLFAIARSVCWDTEGLCVISAKLQESQSTEVSLDIDCLRVEEKESGGIMQQKLKNAYVLRRFEHIQNVTLDGCHALLNVTTYGYEFLPNCGNILQATVEHFYGDSLQQFQCHSPIQMEVLKFQHNEIAAVATNSFINLQTLHELYFQENCLRYMNRLAIESLRELELLHMEKEFCLSIKEVDFFKFTSVTDLRLLALKRIPAKLVEHLPETLRFILIADMRIHDAIDDTDVDDAGEGQIMLTNPMTLRNISIINCSLNSFTLNDPYATVIHLNLSSNAIKHFEIYSHDTNLTARCSLQTLDLSGNKLTHMRTEWLRNLTCLERIILSGNNLKQLSLHELLVALPLGRYIDLSENSLKSLEDTRTTTSTAIDGELQIDSDHTRILVDRNPWNCLWLLNFTHTHPDKFRIFQYQKFISKINVNGLECRTADSGESTHSAIMSTNSNENKVSDNVTLNATTSIAASKMNATTYTLVYGSGRDSKRNQRAEALIIVFMLPLGIAILFVLLYLWIYCQKVFHWSYYRSLPLGRKRAAERFDVIRQIPPTANNVETCMDANLNEDYEIPLNGVTSVCNCAQVASGRCGDKTPCRKGHHITYETLPDEEPHKLYEEIIGSDEQCTADFGHPFYDHLTYVEALQSK